jgi:hypothetical protein
VPALEKVKLNVPPFAGMGVLMLESNDVPSSLVTVCGAAVVLVQVTVVPTLMVMLAGLKPKLPVDESMAMAFVGPDGVAVVPVVGVLPAGAVVGVLPAWVGVGVEPPLVDPPQAASTIIAAKASRTNHARPLRRLDRVVVCVFKRIFSLFCMFIETSSEQETRYFTPALMC